MQVTVEECVRIVCTRCGLIGTDTDRARARKDAAKHRREHKKAEAS